MPDENSKLGNNIHDLPLTSSGKRKCIIPIASGKGGVGKTLVAVNLGIQMASKGKNTVIVDLDVGGSNLHTFMGMKSTRHGVGDFLVSHRRKAHTETFNDYRVQTRYENLQIVQGDQMIPDVANISPSQKKRLLEQIRTLDNEVIILDLGAGSHTSVVDFFLLSNQGIVVCIPNYPSILNSFSLLKTCVYRFFRYYFNDPKIRRIINTVKRRDEEGKFPSFWDILNRIAEENHDTAIQFKNIVDQLKPVVIFNMVDDKQDVKLIRQLIELIYNKLLLDIDILGYLPRSDETMKSVKERTPISDLMPNSKTVKNFQQMATKLMEYAEFNKPLFNMKQYQSSIEELEEQVEDDIPVVDDELKKEVAKILAKEEAKLAEAQRKRMRQIATPPSPPPPPIFQFPKSNIN